MCPGGVDAGSTRTYVVTVKDGDNESVTLQKAFLSYKSERERVRSCAKGNEKSAASCRVAALWPPRSPSIATHTQRKKMSTFNHAADAWLSVCLMATFI